MRKGVLRNFAKFTGKHMCQRLKKVAGLRPAVLLKNSLLAQVFSSSSKILRTPFLQNSSGRLLLLIPKLASNFRSV